MAHVTKFTQVACGHMMAHYDRSVGEKNGNQEIDHARSYLNYNLAAELQPKRQYDFLTQRLSEVKVQKRNDVNVMCDWVVTVPKGLAPEHEEKFFKESFNFLSKMYGEENVISSYVHKDEVTPHMHFSFIPVVADERRGHLKVSAKLAVNRNSLRNFHKEFSDYLEEKFGFKIEILNGETAGGNKSIIELKNEKFEKQIIELEKTVKSLKKEKTMLNSQIVNLENKKQSLEKFLVGSKGIKLAISQINDIQPVKTITGAIKGISIEDIQNLKTTAVSNLMYKNKYNSLLEEHNRIKRAVPSIKERSEIANNSFELRELKKIIKQLPEDIKEKYFSKLKNKQKSKKIER